MTTTASEATFFATPAELRAWFERHGESASELWVGFYRKGSGRPSITWPGAVDEALCVGWIDGIRKTIDAESYRIRFTPRKRRSNWSAVNVARVEALTREGRMREAGLRAFAQRAPEKTGVYSYEQRGTAELDEASRQRFQADPAAWEFFQSRPPGYRKMVTWWVVSAKREETRRRRLEKLIEDSRNGRLISEFRRPGE